MALSVNLTAALAATEATDTASVALSVNLTAALAAAEAADVAAFVATAAHTADLATTEQADTIALAIATGGVSGFVADLAATENQDTTGMLADLINIWSSYTDSETIYVPPEVSDFQGPGDEYRHMLVPAQAPTSERTEYRVASSKARMRPS